MAPAVVSEREMAFEVCRPDRVGLICNGKGISIGIRFRVTASPLGDKSVAFEYVTNGAWCGPGGRGIALLK